MLVLNEGFHFSRRWRKAVQIKGQAPGERAAAGFGGWLQFLFGKPGPDDRINAHRAGRTGHGLPSPVREPFVSQGGLVGGVFRPDGTGTDPGFNGFDLCRRERIALRRHALFLIAMDDALVERRFGYVSGNNGRSVMTALEGKRFGIKTELALLLFFAMTLDAALLQQGTNFGIKINRTGSTYR